ncbi:asparagine synthase (glutamine-hydrolyzing) [Pallidibacillus pasinlerensis]|uniref:asparagine synthase (glutamine-hydrolyzing) n=1 Tax=Pallidibacillus pasinlerensis TaxID=2703818 RepID=A0ABX0A7X8_9BACI|nr:asparagine synthase (glutamine-hydrolyzing) [Pallidibacillus pasinlerensis]NCU18149.1 asparagine synthase (glutamine-hydrolyzing) [Pallidibacillus pasinlerensis]
MSQFIGCIFEQLQNNQNAQSESYKKMDNLMNQRDLFEGQYMDGYIQFVHKGYSSDVDSLNEQLTYENDRYWIIFNGEIYNRVELKEILSKEGVNIETNFIPEIIVNMYWLFGEKVAEHLRGMFIFVIWDKKEETLFGARDHFGIKPLFYSEKEDAIFFGSDKKGIVMLQDNKSEVNNEALQQYLTYQFVPDPMTLDEGIYKLEPGHYFVKKVGLPMVIESYWKPSFQPVHKTEDEFVKEIREVLFDSVKRHMEKDVPTGSYLSGGIDSSFMAAIAKEINPNITTFSVGFERDGFSEIDVAKETAEKIGVENISYVISPEEYMNEVPKIMWFMGDPLADPACVPLYFGAREASKHVKVVFSGEGADEFFGGYNIYREPQSLEIFNKLPGFTKSLLQKVAKIMPEGMKGKSFIERGTTPLEERYIGNAKMFEEEEKRKFLHIYNENVDYTDITKKLYQEVAGYGPVETMQYIDIHTWLRGDILLKADRASAAHSVDLRTPFLDKEVFNVASKIPTSLKTANGTTKYILRKAAEGIVPDHVLHRKKLGFPVPIRHWLKDEMYDWAKKIIRESNTDHLIDKNYVYNLLEQHCSGKGDYSRKIWTVLMFMVWHQVYVENVYSFDNGKVASSKSAEELFVKN